MRFAEAFCAPVFFAVSLALVPSAWGHQLEVETPAAVEVGQRVPVDVIFGHPGMTTEREMLQGNLDKLTVELFAPDGTSQRLPITLAEDRYTGSFTPEAAGWYVIGAELQVGIIQRPLHGIPPQTRIVMTGKSVVRVGDTNAETIPSCKHAVEILPVGDPSQLQPGKTVAVKVVAGGKPLDDPESVLELTTTGPYGISEAAGVLAHQWTIESPINPINGLVRLPLIVPGKHAFLLQFTDETPGRYDGPLDFHSDFSHLRKGDAYRRTRYTVTFHIEVQQP